MSIPSVTTKQPEDIATISATPLSSEPTGFTCSCGHFLKRARHKLTTRSGWLGDYDYAWLCLPTLPWRHNGKQSAPPFYPLESQLPLVLAAACGLQHALAMLAALITPPIAISSSLSLDAETSAYMISASLIGSGEHTCRLASYAPHRQPLLRIGVLSLVQMSRMRLFGGYYLGSGLLAVVGTSFASVSTANAVSPKIHPVVIVFLRAHSPILQVFDKLYADGTCPSTTSEDGTVTREACPEAYGLFLGEFLPPVSRLLRVLMCHEYPGTSLICAFLEIMISFIPARILKRVFPPIVTGTVIVMVGASLTGSSGIANWGGGSNNCMHRPSSGPFQLCPNTSAPRPLPWGSPEFIGLGFLSFVSIVLTELFGSPFLKNASVIVGVAVGCIVAGAAGYIDDSSIRSAPVITFIWVHTFKLRVYPPAVLPVLAVYSERPR